MTVAGRIAGKARILSALVIRETTSRFGRSWGGYFWAVGEPLGGIVLLSFAFSWLVHTPPLGTSFALFYATGLIPFLMYSAVASGAMNALSANKGLFAYPVVTPLDSILARTWLEGITHVLVALLFFPAVLWIEQIEPVIDPARLALSIGLAGALGLGVGTANAAIAGFWPTWRQVWSVLNRPLFLASGVLFPFESVPRDLRPVIWSNPLSHVIAEMRAAFYGPDQAIHASPVFVGFVAASSFVVGGALIVRHKARFAQG